MKKFLALTLAVVMALLLVSCTFVSSNKDEQPDDSKKSPELSRGIIEGDIYTSEYLDLTFTKPESWVYSTDEEIAAAMNLGVDMFLGENFKNALENNPSI